MAAPDESALATASGARTVRELDERPVEDGVLHLIVMGANIFSMHPLPEAGVVSIGRDDDRRRAHRRRERLAPPRAAARRGGAGDRGHGQHQRHAPARQPAAARAARAGAARRGDLDRVGDADDPAAPAHRARAPDADARLLRGPAGRGVRQGVVVGARVRGAAAARRARDVARGGRRDRLAAGAAGRRAGVVRPGRVRDDPVRARRQAGGGIRRPHRRAARRPQRRRAHRRRVLSGRRALRRRADRPRVRAGAGAQRLRHAVVRRHPLRSRDAPRLPAGEARRASPTSTC